MLLAEPGNVDLMLFDEWQHAGLVLYSTTQCPVPRRAFQLMNFEMFSDVILTIDVPTEELLAGDVGTIVERHDVPGGQPAIALSSST